MAITVRYGHYGPLWLFRSVMFHYGSLFFNAVRYVSFRPVMFHYGPLWPITVRYVSLWSVMAHYGSLCFITVRYGHYGPLCPLRSVMAITVRYGSLRSVIACYISLWSEMANPLIVICVQTTGRAWAGEMTQTARTSGCTTTKPCSEPATSALVSWCTVWSPGQTH